VILEKPELCTRANLTHKPIFVPVHKLLNYARTLGFELLTPNMWDFPATFAICIKVNGLATFFIAFKNCIFWGASFEPIKKVAGLFAQKLQGLHGNPLYHCYTMEYRTPLCIKLKYFRAGPPEMPLWNWYNPFRGSETRNAELNGNQNPEWCGNFSQLVTIEIIKSLGISRYKVKLGFWLDLNSEVSCGTNSKWDFCLIRICS